MRQNILFIFFLMALSTLSAQDHPSLSWTKEAIEAISFESGSAPLFESVFATTKKEVDAEISNGIDVPLPKDMAGGYTHERHKANFFTLQKAGNLFLISKEEKYAIYIRDMLLAYAEIYPTFDKHPAEKSYARGKFFWQCLNDANWLVYVSQAYDAIYDWLEPKQRKHLEENLFRPYADYISLGNPRFFNRVHNHSTWGNAAVGMMGLAMRDEELVNRALYGLPNTHIDDKAKDNDGGLIQLRGQKEAGFFAQLDHAFSPDGYYTEGPYYQRYAISPFILFARALENNRPELKIFEYRKGLLKKAVDALLLQTDVQGRFFPINDAQKGMSFKSRELVAAVGIVYKYCGNDPALLSVALKQGKVDLDDAGFLIAKAIKEGKARPFIQQSVELRDGKKGDNGALGILRSRKEDRETVLAFKYTSHGLSHGHFDKLSYSLYDDTGEIIQDYGAARWVNIDQKAGGRYLPENKTWAKQSIAHNTLVINEASHFGGDIQISQDYHSMPYFHDFSNPLIQIASAKENQAYPGVEMQRTLILYKDARFDNPLFIDLFKVKSKDAVKMDLPLWFQGHLLSGSFPYETNKEQLQILGKENGYQYIWKLAQGKPKKASEQISWINKGRIYTATPSTEKTDQLIFGRLGANDPNFNLRPDPCFIVRRQGKKEALFATAIESHGTYSPVDEIPRNPFGKIKEIKVEYNDQQYSAISIVLNVGEAIRLIIVNDNFDKNKTHKLIIGDTSYSWEGPYYVSKK